MKRILIPLLIMLPLAVMLPLPLSAQNTITDELIIDQIERIMEDSEEEVDYTELIESYWAVCENKVNINDEDELSQLIELHLISVFTVEKISEYRKEFGNFQMFEEVAFVEGMDEMTLSILKPLICFDRPDRKGKIKFKDVAKRGRHQLWFQAERCLNEKAGYGPVDDSVLLANPNKKYLGSPEKLLFRYNFKYGDRIEAGFVMEKDAGEKDMLDFVSFHFLIRDWRFVKTLALGDYQLAFGQGVTMGSGAAFTAEGGSLMRKGKKLRASKSANETRYLRGAAATFNYKWFDLTVFYSDKAVDANVSVQDSLGEPLSVTSLQQTGLHRTYGELIDRHAIRLRLIGGNLSFRLSNFQIGYTVHQSQLSCELIPDPRLYNTFYFRGNSLVNQGVDFYYVMKKLAVYGEAAISGNGAPAALVGATIQPAGYIDFTVLYRYYDKKYQNFYSNAFAAGSGTRNERGLYLSTSMTFAPRWQLIATADFPQYDWIKTTAYAPSRSQSYSMRLTHQINDKSLFVLNLRYKDKEKNGPGDNVYMRQLIHDRKWSLRFHITYPVGEAFMLKNSVEYDFSLSYLIYQDIQYKPDGGPFSLAFRYTLFDSPEGMIYAYENDILDAFSTGGLSHKGIRIYLLVKAKILKKLSVNAKIGTTVYSDIDEIGSGLELIEGNVKTDAKLQLIWKI